MDQKIKKAADTVKHVLTCQDYLGQKANQMANKIDDYINDRPRVKELDDLEGWDIEIFDRLFDRLSILQFFIS